MGLGLGWLGLSELVTLVVAIGGVGAIIAVPVAPKGPLRKDGTGGCCDIALLLLLIVAGIGEGVGGGA